MADLSQSLNPVQSHERETFMDVLRGFAVVGIFIANMGSGFAGYNESAHQAGTFLLPNLDHKMEFLHHMFIEGKFYSIFSLLFGWGIALQIKRGMAKGISSVPTIRRRLFFMLLLGAIHLMIWPGDIVFFYALLGFLLLPLRKFSNKTLLITGVILILSPILLYWLKMQWPVLNFFAEKSYHAGDWVNAHMNHIKSDEDYFTLIHKEGWWAILKLNVAGFFYRYGYLFFVSRIPKVLGMFLIGYVVGRSDFYKNIAQHKKLLYWVIACGLIIGLPANYFLAHYMTWYDNDYYNLQIKGFYQTIAYAFGVAPLAMVYVALFMLSFQTKAGKKILSVLAPAGKMAFSNYIMQSLLGNFIFLPMGLGYMGKVGPVFYTVLAIGIFAVQVVISTIWLKFFNYGPLEWVWRSATYGKWQPMIKKVGSQESGVG